MAEKVYLSDDIFIEGPEGLTLAATQCNICGKLFFPKVEYCPHCPDGDLETIPLNRKGTLYTFTTTFMSSMHFEPPSANGYVTLDRGMLVYGPLHIQEDKPFEIGMEMELKIETLWTEQDKEGEKEIVGFRFYPV